MAAGALGGPVLRPDPDLARVTLGGAAVDLAPRLRGHLTHHEETGGHWGQLTSHPAHPLPHVHGSG